MAVQKILGVSVLAAGAMLLSACNDSDTGGGHLVVTPEPELELDPGEYQDTPAGVSSDFAEDLEQVFADMGEISDLIADFSEAATAGVSEPGTYDCPAGGRLITDYDEANDDNEEQAENWDFENCVVSIDGVGQVKISGSVDYYHLNKSTAEGEVWKFSVTYDGITGEVLETGEVLALNGTEEIDELDAEGVVSGTSHLIGTIDFLEMRYGELYVGLTGFESRQEGTEEESEYTIVGKLVASALEGYVTLETPVPVTAEYGYTCPTKGQINAAGDETAELMFGETALGTGAKAALWIGGQLAESYDENECEYLIDLLGIETYDDPL